jgi:hypothetical protein
MARPLRIPIDDGVNDWDALFNDNLAIVLDAPLPLPEPAGLTEANVQATYAAASYAECVVWLTHSVVGKTLYYSDGTDWIPLANGPRAPVRNLTAGATQAAADVRVRYTGAGAVTFAFLAVASWKGRTIVIRNDAALAITLDPNGAELINGAATIALAAGSTASVYNDGSALYAGIMT